MRVFKLKFHSGLHVDSRGSGEPEVSDDFIHSDTISAALSLAWASIHRENSDEFFLNPPFVVSSAFPFCGDMLLFPAPVWNPWINTEPKERKKKKKIRWLSASLFSNILFGQALNLEDAEFISDSIAISKSEAQEHPQLRNIVPWVSTERQRVSIDRILTSPESSLFFFAFQFFAEEAGLYVIVDVEKEELPKLRASLEFLGDCGIGADRNSGLGHFRIADEHEFQMNLPKNEDGWITLSLFNPGPEEDLEALTRTCAYELITRSGWVSGSTVGRAPIRAFVEGSIFSERPLGRVLQTIPESVREGYNLKIEHCAARDLRAVSLPCVQPEYLKETRR